MTVPAENMQKMMKDAVETMGKVLPEDAGGRDAVHVAVFSATSIETVYPSQRLALLERGEWDSTVISANKDTVGIADPFLDGPVPPGTRFWVYLYPRTITSLLHMWGHPSFDGADDSYSRPNEKLASEQWLRDWVATADCPGYEQVMAAVARIADGEVVGCDGAYIHFEGQDAHADIPNEFWDHAEIVLGRPIQGQRAEYFTCSC